MHDVVDAVHGAGEALAVAYVADEEAQPRVVAEHLPDLVLLQFVAGEHDDALRVQVCQRVTQEGLAERTGRTGDQDRRSTQHTH
nr:hypothetical protein GCM10020092_103080 [Actinoplanes digitatis]